MTDFKWKRFGKEFVLFEDEEEIWRLNRSNPGDPDMSDSQVFKEMRIFLKARKPKVVRVDQEGTETDDGVTS